MEELRNISESSQAQASVGTVSSGTVKRARIDAKLDASLESRMQNDNFLKMYLMQSMEQR